MKSRIAFFAAFLFSVSLSAQLPDLIPYRKGKLWGYSDSTKKIVIPCIYDYVNLFYADSARAKLDGKTGYLWKNGTFRPDPPPDTSKTIKWVALTTLYPGMNWEWSVGPARNVTIPAPSIPTKDNPGIAYDSVTNLYGYANGKGKVVIPCIYPDAFPFSEGLAAVKVNDTLWGYIDAKGKLVMRFREVTELGYFMDGMAVVTLDKGAGLVTKKGEWVVLPLMYQIRRHEGVYILYNDFVLLLDKSGKMTDSLFYASCEVNDNGLLRVEYQGRYGFLDGQGKPVTPLCYTEAHMFRQGLAAVADEDGKWGFINAQGKLVIPMKYETDPGEGFEDNRLCEMGWGYIDIYGTEYWEE